MANRLSKVVKKTSAKKQTPVPVRIVSESPQVATDTDTDKPRGVDKWEAQDALRTLQRAAEIRGNKALMKAAKTEATKQIKALSTVGK